MLKIHFTLLPFFGNDLANIFLRFNFIFLFANLKLFAIQTNSNLLIVDIHWYFQIVVVNCLHGFEYFWVDLQIF